MRVKSTLLSVGSNALLNRLRRSPAFRTAAASYLAFASTGLWGLVTIPVAVTFLDSTELGLWAVVNAFLGYLIWMDLGVGPATGRLMTPSVAARDQVEINRWWTATRAILLIQGGVIILVGLVLTPVIIHFLAVPPSLLADARWLLIGGILVTGLALPMRGASGLLIAQNRFYWVPLLQTITPWINLLVFFLLLRKGLGIKAYVWALAVSQSITWIAYFFIILTGPDRPVIDLKGLEKKRFGKLFKLSGNMTISGLSDTILNSLPAIFIARFGGLGVVPLFNFSWRGPQLASTLVQGTYKAFYPGMQRLYVTEKHIEFKVNRQVVGSLTLGIALCAAGMVLSFNTVIVQILAGNKFYAGPVANVGFALAMVTIPMASFFRTMLPISGDLGKISLVALVQLGLFALIGTILWKPFGLAGIAFISALIPLCKGVYGYVRGTKNCGYRLKDVSGRTVVQTVFAICIVVACGTVTCYLAETISFKTSVLGRLVSLPSAATLFFALVPSFIGLCLTASCVIQLFRKPQIEKASFTKNK